MAGTLTPEQQHALAVVESREKRALQMLRDGSTVTEVLDRSGMTRERLEEVVAANRRDRRPPADCGHVLELTVAQLEQHPANIRTDLGDVDEGGARRLVERMALVLQGSLLERHAPAAVADAFWASRLGTESGRALGTLPRGVDVAGVLARAQTAG